MKYDNIKDLGVSRPWKEDRVWKCEVILKRTPESLAILHGESAKEAKQMANATAYMMDTYYHQFGLDHLLTPKKI